MRNNQFIKTSMYCFLAGCLLFAFYQGWIIVQLPWKRQSAVESDIPSMHKKKVQLFFWQHDTWNHEYVELIWSSNPTQNITTLLNRWLGVLEENSVLRKKVTIDTSLLSPNNHAYISFNRNPFTKESNTFEKLMLVEGLLKTIRENDLSISAVWFLAHHQPLKDPHLDFSNPWPIIGFFK